MRGVLQAANLASMISGFADQAALALEIAEHRREAEHLVVLSDRDRIARDCTIWPSSGCSPPG